MFVRLLVLSGLGLLYWFPIRKWFGRWGTTPDERARAMAGDSVIPEPTHLATHAVTVEATPNYVWPWLLQMGYQRGGLYSYDWLDLLFGFLDRPSADVIIPELQHLAVGDKIQLGPRQQLTVTALEHERALVLSYSAHALDWVWQFALYPIDGKRTRLVSRGTERFPRTLSAWLLMRVMEPAAFVMTRRMLLGVKRRAESLKTRRDTSAIQGVAFKTS